MQLLNDADRKNLNFVHCQTKESYVKMTPFNINFRDQQIK